MKIWTIYNNRIDYPGWYVAECYKCSANKVHYTGDMIADKDLSRLRANFESKGLMMVGRYDNDPVDVVESWI